MDSKFVLERNEINVLEENFFGFDESVIEIKRKSFPLKNLSTRLFPIVSNKGEMFALEMERILETGNKADRFSREKVSIRL